MPQRFSDPNLPRGMPYTPPPHSHLSKRNVQVGEAYSIKGDAQLLAELEETVQSLADKKLKLAEEEARKIIDLAKQEAKRQADKLILDATAEAETKANQLISEAQAQHDAVLEQARQDGFDAGFAKGHVEAVHKVESETVQLLEAVHTVAEQAYQVERLVLGRFQDDAFALVTHVAKRIIHQELEQSPEKLLEVLHQACESLYLTGRIKVVLGQRYMEMIQHFTPTTEALMTRLNRFEWVGDPKMSPTDIHLLSKDGAFSIGPDTQVESLLAPLENKLPLDMIILAEEQPSKSALINTPQEENLEKFAPVNNSILDISQQDLDKEIAFQEEDVNIQNSASNSTVLPDVETSALENIQPVETQTVTEAVQQEITPWQLEELDTVMMDEAAQHLEVSKPQAADIAPEAVPVDFPDLSSLLDEFAPQLDQNPSADDAE